MPSWKKIAQMFVETVDDYIFGFSKAIRIYRFCLRYVYSSPWLYTGWSFPFLSDVLEVLSFNVTGEQRVVVIDSDSETRRYYYRYT